MIMLLQLQRKFYLHFDVYKPQEYFFKSIEKIFGEAQLHCLRVHGVV